MLQGIHLFQDFFVSSASFNLDTLFYCNFSLVQISKQQRSLGLAVWNREFVYAFDNISGQDSERFSFGYVVFLTPVL